MNNIQSIVPPIRHPKDAPSKPVPYEPKYRRAFLFGPRQRGRHEPDFAKDVQRDDKKFEFQPSPSVGYTAIGARSTPWREF